MICELDQMTEKKSIDRLAELDALRGLAALGVVYYHFIFRYPVPALPKDKLLFQLFGYFTIPEWYLGLMPVYLFFMISGFVIFITAEKCKTVAEFGYRRFSRLYPVYWGAIIVLTLAAFLNSKSQVIGVGQFIVNLTMLQRYLGVPHISGVFWSLSVELSFYFLIAGMIRFGLMPRYKYVLLLWSLLTFLYGFFPAPNPIPWPIVHILALDYGHCFVFGICIYELRRAKLAGIEKPDRLILVLIALSIASNIIRYPAAIVVMLSFLQGIFYIAATRTIPFLRNGILVYLGGISYALYLVHEPLGILVRDVLTLPRLVELALALALALLAAVALTNWVERPSLNWLRVHRPAWTR